MTNIDDFPEAVPGAGEPFIPPKHPKDIMSPAELIEYYDELQSINSDIIEET